ncbi:hypothetical protein PCANC_00829 [Puccinia coronata f. sp. avenae]|uniref:Secreted protein n=1 Tax=Puccinia coronata f. sp. avenae TaxID=200324 RepID=A0A2N5SXH0_9BASI|nr:hypothetical protein PCANC_10316 [Puccinia coronata f. sp. avenae]PLW58161.1 hypothetical protein PCANC_00829 [Puccinia coronata f. sp. avenae]
MPHICIPVILCLRLATCRKSITSTTYYQPRGPRRTLYASHSYFSFTHLRKLFSYCSLCLTKLAPGHFPQSRSKCS